METSFTVKFRSSFSLKANDRYYVSEKGMDTVRSHAQDFVKKRLAPAEPPMMENRPLCGDTLSLQRSTQRPSAAGDVWKNGIIFQEDVN